VFTRECCNAKYVNVRKELGCEILELLDTYKASNEGTRSGHTGDIVPPARMILRAVDTMS
jgi:hypothetical protein